MLNSTAEVIIDASFFCGVEGFCEFDCFELDFKFQIKTILQNLMGFTCLIERKVNFWAKSNGVPLF